MKIERATKCLHPSGNNLVKDVKFANSLIASLLVASVKEKKTTRCAYSQDNYGNYYDRLICKFVSKHLSLTLHASITLQNQNSILSLQIHDARGDAKIRMCLSIICIQDMKSCLVFEIKNLGNISPHCYILRITRRIDCLIISILFY